MTRTATCCCKACQITVKGDPVLNGVCHCDDCKRRTGSAFGWSAYFTAEQVLDQHGEIETYEPSGEPGQIRSFCRNCGSTMWWTTPSRPNETGIAGGTFIQPPLPVPHLSARHSHCAAWLALPADIEQGL